MTDRPYYYDRKGRPVEMMEWARLFEASPDGYRFVGKTTIGPYLVSTVWIGLDMNFGDGPPLIFETMIFGPGELGGYQWRWPTEEAALAGHDQAVAAVMEKVGVSHDPMSGFG